VDFFFKFVDTHTLRSQKIVKGFDKYHKTL